MSLKLPQGVSPMGPVKDLAEAYMKSVVALPEIFTAFLDRMEELSDSLAVLSLYAERKGIADGIIGKDELDHGDEETSTGEAVNGPEQGN